MNRVKRMLFSGHLKFPQSRCILDRSTTQKYHPSTLIAWHIELLYMCLFHSTSCHTLLPSISSTAEGFSIFASNLILGLTSLRTLPVPKACWILLMSFWSKSTESEYIILYHLLLGLGQKHQCRAQKATATHCKTTWGVHTANICKCNLEALLSEPEALIPGPPAISCCTAGCFASDLHLGDAFKTVLRHFRSFSVC